MLHVDVHVTEVKDQLKQKLSEQFRTYGLELLNAFIFVSTSTLTPRSSNLNMKKNDKKTQYIIFKYRWIFQWRKKDKFSVQEFNINCYPSSWLHITWWWSVEIKHSSADWLILILSVINTFFYVNMLHRFGFEFCSLKKKMSYAERDKNVKMKNNYRNTPELKEIECRGTVQQ